MRKLFIGAALFIGFSSFCFSQTADRVIVKQQVEIQNGEEIVMKNGMKAVIENPNVTIYPGETIIFLKDSLERIIARKDNGQIIGLVRVLGSGNGDDISIKIENDL